MNQDDKQSLTVSCSRKFYFLDEERSVGDPDKTFITVPNIPFITGMNKIRSMGFGKSVGANVVLEKGAGKPFINVSFSGLLWGYQSEYELPCKDLARPSECGRAKSEVDIFASKF